MKTFEEIKKYIVEFATEKGACATELRKARNATNERELLNVVKTNINWTISNGLYNSITMEDHFGKELMIEFNLANTGDDNTGFSNTGDRNTGDRNTGDRNTGDRNTGDSNTGDRNTGDRNTGYSNTGDRNTGDRNTGDRNTGDRNTGDSNTGDRNTGYSNTGDWNTGDRNTGYSNTGDRNTGAFCTGESKIKIFNKESNWTHQEFINSRVYQLLCQVDTKLLVYENAMTDEEKAKYPSYKTAEGYLKDIPFKEAFGNCWHNWNETNRAEFKNLPNFDAEIFESITGVKI
jgi:hypothetical protein